MPNLTDEVLSNLSFEQYVKDATLLVPSKYFPTFFFIYFSAFFFDVIYFLEIKCNYMTQNSIISVVQTETEFTSRERILQKSEIVKIEYENIETTEVDGMDVDIAPVSATSTSSSISVTSTPTTSTTTSTSHSPNPSPAPSTSPSLAPSLAPSSSPSLAPSPAPSSSPYPSPPFSFHKKMRISNVWCTCSHESKAELVGYCPHVLATIISMRENVRENKKRKRIESVVTYFGFFLASTYSELF